MAGDWIKMGRDLLTHPKVVRISSALKADKLRVIGALFAIWTVGDTHSADGHLPGFSMDAMDDELRWPGFCIAMKGVGWLEPDGEGGVKIPEFSKHNGASAKRRAQEAERKQREREGEESHPQSVRKASASKADGKRTREEKRREEVPIGAKAPMDPDAGRVGDLPPKDPSASNGDTQGGRVWTSYSAAYEKRYGVAPIRNATVNAALARFAKMVPADEGPDIAAFYVASDEPFYVRMKHPAKSLMQDAEKLRTEWATGKHGGDSNHESIADKNRRAADEFKRAAEREQA